MLAAVPLLGGCALIDALRDTPSVDGPAQDTSIDSGPIGDFAQQAYVKASNTDANDLFGRSVALSVDGNTMAIGADGESSAARVIGGNSADNTALSLIHSRGHIPRGGYCVQQNGSEAGPAREAPVKGEDVRLPELVWLRPFESPHRFVAWRNDLAFDQ